MPIWPALHGWRRYGKRSSAPRAIPNRTIWNENRWFSRYSRCSRKRRGKPPPLDQSRHFGRTFEGIRGGEGKQEIPQEEQEGEEGSQSRCRTRHQKARSKEPRGQGHACSQQGSEYS